jgi:AcrR family transcriptional regulator
MNVSARPEPFEASSSPRSDKAQAILAGALQVFMASGYTAASMDRIAAAAGVSKSTLYSYFQDKEGLFVALIQKLTHTSHQLVFGLLTNPDLQDPPEQVLRKMATLVLDQFSKNQSLLTLMRLIMAESERFPKLGQTFVENIQKPMLEQLALYLASQPQLQLSDPMVAARVFAGSLVHYLIIQKIMHGDEVLPLDRDRMIDGLIEILTASGTGKSQ